MSEEEKLELKASIEAELQNLARDIEQLSEWVKPIPPDRAIGRLTRMEAINSKSMHEANLRKAKTRTAQLKKALVRIDEDEDFGICLSCDRPIPLKRIMLVPESTRCVRCLGG